MSLNALELFKVRIIQIVNTYIPMPVSAANLLPIEREPDTSNGLLNVLRFAHLYLIVVTIIETFDFIPFLISLDGLRFENIEIVLLDVLDVLYEYDFAHVFAICISEKTLLN